MSEVIQLKSNSPDTQTLHSCRLSIYYYYYYYYYYYFARNSMLANTIPARGALRLGKRRKSGSLKSHLSHLKRLRSVFYASVQLIA